jgi:hypothetical protein
MTKEEMCKILSELYGWNENELLKNNERQIYTLYSACLDEDGNLRKPKR